MTIRAHDEFGKRFKLTLSGWPARIFQHEYDHLQVSGASRHRSIPWRAGCAPADSRAPGLSTTHPTTKVHSLVRPPAPFTPPCHQGTLLPDRMQPEVRENIAAGLEALVREFQATNPGTSPAL